MKVITKEQYLHRFGLVIENGALSKHSRYHLCSMIRQMIRSRTLLTKLDLHNQFRSVMQPIIENYDTVFFDKCLERLCSLGDIAELNREGKDKVYLATRPRWIQLNDNHAILLGDTPDLQIDFSPVDDYDMLRRFTPDEKTRSILDDYHITEEPLPQSPSLPNWQEKINELDNKYEFFPLDEKILILAGTSNDFWGKPDFEHPAGRWKFLHDKVQNDVYFGCKKVNSYSEEKSWLLLRKQDKTIRIMTLHDYQEGLNLCLARLVENAEKLYLLNDDLLGFAFRLPEAWQNYLCYFASEQPQYGMWKLCDLQLLTALTFRGQLSTL